MPNEAEPLGHAEGEVAMQPTDSTSVGSDRKGAGRARKAVSLPKAPTWLANAGSYFRVSSPPLIQPPARLAEFSGLIVALICSLFIFSTLHPDLIFSNTVTTGGDMGAHVVAPDFLKEHLLPSFSLNGWSDAWYAGYPIYQFYMVVPALLIVLVDVGPPVWLGAILLALVVGGGTFLLSTVNSRFVKGLIGFSMVVAGLLCVDVPENVAFKIVTVLGPICLPISAWVLARMARSNTLVQALVPVGAMYFIFDSHFEILGGNGASTMAGEFSFALSLNLVLLALGFAIRGLETGKYRVLTAVLIGLAATTHVIPIFFLAVGLFVAFLLRPGVRQLAWLASVGAVGGLLSAFWLGAFYLHSDYLNDMGWEKTLTYGEMLFPSTLPYREVVLGLALIGAVMSLIVPNRLGLILLGSLGGSALLVRYVQQPPLQRFWNERVLPFWFLALALLAAVGLAMLVNALGALVTETNDPRRRNAGIIASAVGAVGTAVVLGLTSTDWWPWMLPFVAILAAGIWILFVEFGPQSDPRGVLRSIVGSVVAIAAIGAIMLPTQAINLDRTATTDGGVAVTDQSGMEVMEDWIGKSVQVPSPTFTKEGTTTMLSGYEIGPFVVTSRKNVVGDWAAWNYSGYEGKDKYPEFEQLMTKMGEIGRTNGCGRAMWEYFENLGKYGTPMAPMLLPMYTDGCIGSMEGLFFEASMTTPFHFLNQSLLSARPSSPKRDMPYEGLNVAKGVKMLQLYGVKYYMAKSEEAIAQAADVPELTEVGRVPSTIKTRNDSTDGADTEKVMDWVIYEVADADLVVGLDHLPAVMTDVEQGHGPWLDPSVAWYQDTSAWDVMLAADGPSNWPRVKCAPKTTPAEVGAKEDQRKYGLACAETPKSVTVAPATITNVDYEDADLSFDVDEIGKPVLVKVSYFPRWKVDGAKGPYRVAPNLMLVVPTETHVTMYYGNTWVEYVTWALTILGLLCLVWMGVTSEWNFGRTWHFSGDDVPNYADSSLAADPDITRPSAGFWQPHEATATAPVGSDGDNTDPELVISPAQVLAAASAGANGSPASDTGTPEADQADDSAEGASGEGGDEPSAETTADASDTEIPLEAAPSEGTSLDDALSDDALSDGVESPELGLFDVGTHVEDEPVVDDFTVEWQPPSGDTSRGPDNDNVK